jgi:hypothetical protein
MIKTAEVWSGRQDARRSFAWLDGPHLVGADMPARKGEPVLMWWTAPAPGDESP